MRRVLFGVIWFIVFIIVLNIIYGIVLGASMSRHAGFTGAMDRQQMMVLMQSYRQQHAGSIMIWRGIILIISIILAVTGAVSGFLPGTRKKKVADPVQ